MTTTYSEIIVGTDGSPTANRAVEAAIALAKQTGARLTIATAWYREMSDAPVLSERAQIPGGDLAGHEARWAEQTAGDAAIAARAAGVEDVRVANPVGGPAEALLELAEARRDSLIVVGSLGLSDRTERFLGNIPHAISHHAIRDVLIVDTGADGTEHAWNSVALATDGSPTAALAVEHGYGLAKMMGASVTLFTINKDEVKGQAVLSQAAAPFTDGPDLGRKVVVNKDAAQGLIDGATEFDLLVIGNKGMSGPSRLLGSVANDVTHHLPTDILLVNTTR